MKSFIAVSVLLLCGSFADAAIGFSFNVGRSFNPGFNRGFNNNINRGFNVGYGNNFNRGFNVNNNFNRGYGGNAQFFNGGYINRGFNVGYGASFAPSYAAVAFAAPCYVPPVQTFAVQQQYYLAPQPVLQLAVPSYAPVYAPACGVGYGQGGCGVGAGRLFGY